MKAKKQKNEECVCISKTKYQLIRSALRIGLEAIQFSSLRKSDPKLVEDIAALVATV